MLSKLLIFCKFWASLQTELAGEVVVKLYLITNYAWWPSFSNLLLIVGFIHMWLADDLERIQTQPKTPHLHVMLAQYRLSYAYCLYGSPKISVCISSLTVKLWRIHKVIGKCRDEAYHEILPGYRTAIVHSRLHELYLFLFLARGIRRVSNILQKRFVQHCITLQSFLLWCFWIERFSYFP